MTKTLTIIVYHGKQGDEYLLAETAAQKTAVLRSLFERLDESGYYRDEVQYLELARAGNKAAIRGILESRSNCGFEYEDWDFEEVEIP